VNENKVYQLYLTPSFKFMLVFGLVVFVGMSIFIIFLAPGFRGRSGPPPFFGVFWIAGMMCYLFWVFRIPHKIILHGDGLIEFISVVRQIKVQAGDVKSIKPEGATYGFLVVRAGRKIRLLAQFDDFHDFVSNLKALNPSIVLRGC
jgi:hypothetical protein